MRFKIQKELGYFFKSGFISALLVGGTGLINLITKRALSLSLSDINFGYFYSVLSFFTVLVAILDLGLNQSATILLGKYHSLGQTGKTRRVYRIFLLIRVSIALVLAPLIVAFSEPLSKYYFNFIEGKEALASLSLMFVANMILGCLLATYDAFKMPVARNLLLFMCYGLTGLSLAVATKIGSVELNTVSVIYSMAFCLSILAFLLYNSRFLGLTILSPSLSGSKRIVLELIGISKWIAVSSGGLILIANIDMLLLAQLVAYSQVAIYNIAISIMQILLGFFLLIPQMATPLLIKAWYDENPKRMMKIGALVSGLALLIMAMFYPLVFFYLERFIVLLFGTGYASSRSPALVLLLGIPIYAASQVQQVMLNIMGKQRVAAFIILIAVFFNLICSLSLIRWLGIIGAAVGNLLTFIFILVCSFFAAAHAMKVRMF